MIEGRYGTVGEDNRRRPFSRPFSSIGVGVMLSSMIKTQPELSLADVSFTVVSLSLWPDFPLPWFDGARFFSPSKSALRRFFGASEPPVFIPKRLATEDVAEFDAVLPDMLPIRKRGTRVCNFCSRLRTLARISDTICTPRLREVVVVVVVIGTGTVVLVLATRGSLTYR